MAYVDDINFVAASESDLERIIDIVIEYVNHFGLELSMAKTKIWSTDDDAAARLSQKYGFPTTNVLDALGLQWPVSKGVDLDFPKEYGRLHEADRRLARIAHMPVSLSKKCDFLSVAVLSLLDYLGPSHPEPALALRSGIKVALANKFAAPEILFNITCRASLDPFHRWMMASLKLWHTCMQTCENPLDLQAIIGGGVGRLGMAAKRVAKSKIMITAEGFKVGDKWLPSREPWCISKKVLALQLLECAFERLIDRRPSYFQGLTQIHVKHHRKFLASLSCL